MINMAEGSRWLGPVWWILQVLRVGNIIALLSIVASSVVMIIKTNIVNNFFFFQAASHVITCGVALALIVSELPQPAFVRDFYRHNWPIFSTVDACNKGHSLAWLGAWIIALGVWTMGSLNTAGLVAKLSLPLWRLTLGSGILALVFGPFNLAASCLFRNQPRGVTARMVREHGANVYDARASAVTVLPPAYDIEHASLGGGGSGPVHDEKRARGPAAYNRFSQRFAQGFKQNRVTRLFARDGKPQISGPIVYDDVEALRQPDRREEVRPGSPESGRRSWEAQSWEQDRASPIAPNVQVSGILRVVN